MKINMLTLFVVLAVGYFTLAFLAGLLTTQFVFVRNMAAAVERHGAD